MRKMEQKRMRKRILMMWMTKKVVMRMKKETRMGKSRMVTQKNDLQRRKRMKWIQRGRRQRTGLQLESSPPISSAPSISPPSFQPVLAPSISLWLHTISDEERLEMLSKREDSSFLLTRSPSPSVTFPTRNYSSPLPPIPSALTLSQTILFLQESHRFRGPGLCASLLLPFFICPFFFLNFLFFLVTTMSEILDSFSAPQTCCHFSSLCCRHRSHSIFQSQFPAEP